MWTSVAGQITLSLKLEVWTAGRRRYQPSEYHANMPTYGGVINAMEETRGGPHLPETSGNEKVEDTDAMTPMIEKANATVSKRCKTMNQYHHTINVYAIRHVRRTLV